jgi:excinuclease ABC subunit A
MPAEELVVHGAREHNLKDVTVALPRNKLICITGLSGSGKSSLAFDTIYAGGPAALRRVALGVRAAVPADDGEARRRLDRRALAGDLDRPEDDVAEPALDGRHGDGDLRLPALLYARVGRPALPVCGRPIAGQSLESIVDQILALPDGTRFTVNAPVVRDRKGEFKDVLEELRREGFTRVKVDGEQTLLEDEIVLDKKFKHTIEVVVDRLVMKPTCARGCGSRSRRRRSSPRGSSPSTSSTRARSSSSRELRVPDHGVSLPSCSRGIFSFNSPHGACPRCTGPRLAAGDRPDLLVPDGSVSIADGALVPWSVGNSSFYESVINAICERYEIDPDAPWDELTEDAAEPLPLRHAGRARVRPVPQPDGPQRVVHARVRGHRPEPAAALQGHRLVAAARADRGVHVVPARARSARARA